MRPHALNRLFISSLAISFLFGLNVYAAPPVKAPAVKPQVVEGARVANEYMQNKQWDFACLAWRQIIEMDPTYVPAHIGLADSLASAGFMADAITYIQQLVTQNPDPALRVKLADLYLKTNLPVDAEKIYRGVLEKDPLQAGAFQGLVNLSEALPADKAPMKQSLETFLDARSKEAREKALALLHAGKAEESLPYFAIATSYINKISLFNDYGAALFLSGKTQQSYNGLKRLKEQGNYWNVFANAALLEMSLGKTSEAQADMEKALSMCEDTKEKARLYNNLGYLLETLGKPQKAVFAYQHAVELDPTLTKAQQNLAFAFQNNRDFLKAIETYTKILARDPKNVNALNQTGFTYEMMGKPKNAILYYQKAVAADPKFRDGYYNLGMVYKKLGKTDLSSANFKKMTELEFQEMEAKDIKTLQNQEAGIDDNKTKLLTYADVFYTPGPEAPKPAVAPVLKPAANVVKAPAKAPVRTATAPRRTVEPKKPEAPKVVAQQPPLARTASRPVRKPDPKVASKPEPKIAMVQAAPSIEIPQPKRRQERKKPVSNPPLPVAKVKPPTPTPQTASADPAVAPSRKVTYDLNRSGVRPLRQKAPILQTSETAVPASVMKPGVRPLRRSLAVQPSPARTVILTSPDRNKPTISALGPETAVPASNLTPLVPEKTYIIQQIVPAKYPQTEIK